MCVPEHYTIHTLGVHSISTSYRITGEVRAKVKSRLVSVYFPAAGRCGHVFCIYIC